MEKWYVARSKPRNEELLWKQFCLRNIEAYYPSIKVQTVNPRSRQLQSYFPCYIFVHVDLNLISKSTLDWMPGSAGLVSFGDEPAYIPDNLVYEIKQRINNLDNDLDITHPSLCKGDKVIIHNGSFKGYEGVFDTKLSGVDRVRVLLSLMNNRFINIELPAKQIHLAN